VFEMGAKFADDGWSADNKKPKQKTSHEIKPPQKHQLHFTKEKRRGKTVTIVTPFYLEKKRLQGTLKTLKKRLGCGGTVKDNSLEFQGEIRAKLEIELIKLEFGIKNR